MDGITRKNKGFTLTELLTTVATIGVVTSLLLPVLTKAKHRARDVICLSNQRNIKSSMESAFSTVVPDYNSRYNPADIQELNRVMLHDYSKPFEKDPQLHDLGVYYSRPLTCPYSFGNGKVRAPFSTATTWNGAIDHSDGTKDIKHVTYNYNLTFEHLHVLEESNQYYAVNDLPNYKYESLSLRVNRMFPNVQQGGDRVIALSSSVLHPHKGKGFYATFGDGKQEWINFDRGTE